MKRITKFINSLQGLTLDANALIDECLQLNLKQYLPETTKSILASKLGDNQRECLIDTCVALHQRYEGFADLLIPAIESAYWVVPVLTDQSRKRNILRMITELYFRGLFKEYKRIFRLLN
jgi:hypothetical protein